jgi:DNA-binding MarR family transcriptional regulator
MPTGARGRTTRAGTEATAAEAGVAAAEGAGPAGTGPAGTGPAGTGPAGTGPAGTGAAKPAGDDGYPFDSVSAYPAAEISAAWQRERPGVPVSSIEIVTPIWRLAKLLADDRRRVLRACGVDPATLDLLSVLRRAGPPYRLTTREIAERALVTAGAVSQRVARAERERLVHRTAAGDGTRSVFVTLAPAGHALVESAVDQVLGRETQLVRSLDPGQRAELAALLDRLLRDVAEQVSGG